MDPIGTALLHNELVHTKFWPGVQLTLKGLIDLEKEYKENLSGSIVTVMEESVDKVDYLILCHPKNGGAFLWTIDKRDVRVFIPVIKKYGTVIPAGLTPMEEFVYLAKSLKSESDKYNFK